MRFNIAFCEELWKCNFQNMDLKAFLAVPPSFELRWPSIQFLWPYIQFLFALSSFGISARRPHSLHLDGEVKNL
jgi:hypothetical protein